MSTTVFRATTPVDLIACVPPVVGFHPTDSLVMLTMGPAQFHARIDLPTSNDQWGPLGDVLLRPCVRHKVESVAFLIYAAEPDPTFGEFLADAWSDLGIAVQEVVLVKPDTYRTLDGGEDAWTPYDLADHPITLKAALGDHAPTDETREALTVRVRPGAADMVYDDETINCIQPFPVDEVVTKVEQGEGTGPETIQQALRSLSAPGWTDDLLQQVNVAHAPVWANFWIAALRATAPGSRLSYEAAAFAAYFSWWSGRGAAAWIALEHCDPNSRFVQMLHVALSNAIDPHAWKPRDQIA